MMRMSDAVYRSLPVGGPESRARATIAAAGCRPGDPATEKRSGSRAAVHARRRDGSARPRPARDADPGRCRVRGHRPRPRIRDVHVVGDLGADPGAARGHRRDRGHERRRPRHRAHRHRRRHQGRTGRRVGAHAPAAVALLARGPAFPAGRGPRGAGPGAGVLARAVGARPGARAGRPRRDRATVRGCRGPRRGVERARATACCTPRPTCSCSCRWPSWSPRRRAWATPLACSRISSGRSRSCERLGSPPIWSAHLSWAGIQQGILLNRPDALKPHARALVSASPHSPIAAVMAQAGRVWTATLAGSVDADAVEAAAHGLASVGLGWDGARLAGHGASRSTDRKVAARLLVVRTGTASQRRHAQDLARPDDEQRPTASTSERRRPQRARARRRAARAAGQDLRRDRRDDLHLASHGRAPHRPHPAPAGRDLPVRSDRETACRRRAVRSDRRTGSPSTRGLAGEPRSDPRWHRGNPRCSTGEQLNSLTQYKTYPV